MRCFLKVEQPRRNAVNPKRDSRQYPDQLGGKEAYNQMMIQQNPSKL
jgi:hypothetical protein